MHMSRATDQHITRTGQTGLRMSGRDVVFILQARPSFCDHIEHFRHPHVARRYMPLYNRYHQFAIVYGGLVTDTVYYQNQRQ